MAGSVGIPSQVRSAGPGLPQGHPLTCPRSPFLSFCILIVVLVLRNIANQAGCT